MSYLSLQLQGEWVENPIIIYRSDKYQKTVRNNKSQSQLTQSRVFLLLVSFHIQFVYKPFRSKLCLQISRMKTKIIPFKFILNLFVIYPSELNSFYNLSLSLYGDFPVDVVDSFIVYRPRPRYNLVYSSKPKGQSGSFDHL